MSWHTVGDQKQSRAEAAPRNGGTDARPRRCRVDCCCGFVRNHAIRRASRRTPPAAAAHGGASGARCMSSAWRSHGGTHAEPVAPRAAAGARSGSRSKTNNPDSRMAFLREVAVCAPEATTMTMTISFVFVIFEYIYIPVLYMILDCKMRHQNGADNGNGALGIKAIAPCSPACKIVPAGSSGFPCAVIRSSRARTDRTRARGGARRRGRRGPIWQ
jgi:hypothetical protein